MPYLTPFRFAHVALLVLIGAAALDPAVAAADVARTTSPTEKARAKKHFERGRALVSSARYAAAYDEFAAGFTLTERPLFLFNMGECKRALAQTTAARELYERYVAAEPNGDQAAAARARLVQLGPSEPTRAARGIAARPAPARTVTAIVSEPPQPAAEGGRREGGAPASTPVVVVPTLIVQPPVAPIIHVTQQLSVEASLHTNEPPPRSPERSLWSRPVLWIGVGAAIVAGTVAVYTFTRSETMCTGTCIDLR